MVRWAVSGGGMTAVDRRHYACNAHRGKGTYDNHRGIDATPFENAVFHLFSRRIAEDYDLSGLVHRATEDCRAGANASGP